MSVFDSIPTTPVVLHADQPLDEAHLAAVAFLARSAAAHWSPIAPISVSSSSGQATSAWRRSPPRGRTSSCAARRWTRAAWPRRRSIGDCPRCAATTASPTSMAASAPTRRSTFADHGSIPLPGVGWTAASWPPSCTPPSEPLRPTPGWLCRQPTTAALFVDPSTRRTPAPCPSPAVPRRDSGRAWRRNGWPSG